VLVLAAKFAFDWFALIKPLEKPVIALWNFNWLGSPTSWGDADFILVIARCLPSFIVMFNDTQIFYYFAMALFGSIKGIVQLNLGSVSTFQVGSKGGGPNNRAGRRVRGRAAAAQHRGLLAGWQPGLCWCLLLHSTLCPQRLRGCLPAGGGGLLPQGPQALVGRVHLQKGQGQPVQVRGGRGRGRKGRGECVCLCVFYGRHEGGVHVFGIRQAGQSSPGPTGFVLER
jgi:hypothetical protein